MSKVRVKGSYRQGYCSIMLKHNYVSSGPLLHALAIDCSLYSVLGVTFRCLCSPPPKKKIKKHEQKDKLSTKVKPKQRAQLEKLFPGDIPSIQLPLSKSDTRWQSLDLVRGGWWWALWRKPRSRRQERNKSSSLGETLQLATRLTMKIFFSINYVAFTVTFLMTSNR